VSDDQDFFFDEDEKPQEKPEPKKASSTAKKQVQTPSRPATAAGERTVTMTVASLIGVVALLAGVIIGILIPTGGNSVPAPTQNVGTGVPAPQLTPEELESGQLPEGHPDIGSMGGETTVAPDGSVTPTE